MAADLLDYPQRDAGVTHLSQSRAAETVGASSLDTNSLTGFSEKTRRRVAGDVTPMMSGEAAWE